MPLFGAIAKIAAKVVPNIPLIGNAIKAVTGGPMGVLGGISSISKSMGNLFNNIGKFAETLQKGLGSLSRPAPFGFMPRPTISNFMRGFLSGFKAGFAAGQKAAEKAGESESTQKPGTKPITRNPGESIEDFIARILNNLIKKTEWNLDTVGRKADGAEKVTQEQQTEIQKLTQQLQQLQQLLQNTMKNFHDVKMNAVRHISG